MLKAIGSLLGFGDGSPDAAPSSRDYATPSRKRGRTTSEHPHALRRCSSRNLMPDTDAVTSQAMQKSTNPLRSSRFQRRPTEQPSTITDVILDSDDESPKAKKARPSTTPRARGLNPITDRRSDPPIEESRKEARLLGSKSYGKPIPSTHLIPDNPHREREPGETIVNDPVSRESMTKKKAQMPGGLKPSNTLDTARNTKLNTRANYREGHRGQTRPVSKAFTTPNPLNQAQHPHKKRKLDGSPLDIAATNKPLATYSHTRSSRISPAPLTGQTQADAISLDDSQDAVEPIFTPSYRTNGHHRSNSSEWLSNTGERTMVAELKMPGPKQAPTTPDNVDRANSGSHDLTHPPRSRTRTGQGVRHDIINSDGEQGSEFLKNATRQRKMSQEQDGEVQELHSVSIGHKTRQKIPTRHPTESTPLRATARIVTLPPESPDELQATSDPRHQPSTNLGRDLDSLTPNHQLAQSIMGDRNRGMLTKPSRASEDGSPPLSQNFKLKHLVAPFLMIKEDFYQLEVYDDGVFCVTPQDPKLVEVTEDMFTRHVSEIYQMHVAMKSKALIGIKLRGRPGERLSFQFASDKQGYDFLHRIQALNDAVSAIEKSDNWMVDAFDNHVDEKETLEAGDHQDRPSKAKQELSTFFKSSARQARQTRLTDNLDAPRGDTRPKSVITGSERRAYVSHWPTRVSHTEESIRPACESRTVASTTDVSHHFSGHSTRTQPTRTSRQATQAKARSPSPEKIKPFKTGKLGDPWSEPLIYPRNGKKRETVEWAALERLDDDEFLNDTLVGFFSRYVQQQLEESNPAQLKRMHFFNSFFFESLTRNAKTKKDINFETVSKWTKTIDIFQRDFVIVPVNQNLHWYLVIICNLKHWHKSQQEIEDDPDGSDSPEQETEADAPASDQVEHDTRQYFEDLSIQDSPSKVGKKSRKKRPSLQKYDPNAPIIISLDSLDQSRSAACGYLKQYIIRQAAKEKGREIEERELPAMTAKKIPTQSNFSDCGLYVCLYLEQFLRDPDRFIRAILQRESFPWPDTIESHQLRSRFTSLLLNLHNNQKNPQAEAQIAIPELGNILADTDASKSKENPDPKSPINRPSTPEEARETRERLEARMRSKIFEMPKMPKIDTPDKITVNSQQTARTTNTARKRQREPVTQPKIETETIVIEDDPDSPSANRMKRISRQQTPYFSQHNDPAELAEKLRREWEEVAAVNAAPRERSDSVSTEFLQESKMYDNLQTEGEREAAAVDESDMMVQPQTVEQTEVQSASQVSAEIAETQELEQEPLRGGELPEWPQEEKVSGQGGREDRARSNEIIID